MGKHDPVGRNPKWADFEKSIESTPGAPFGVPDGVPRGSVDKNKGKITKSPVNLNNQWNRNPRRTA